MKRAFFLLFKKISRVVSGKGLAKLPFAMLFYQFLYKRLKPRGIVEVRVGKHTLLVNSRDTCSAPYLIMHGEWDPSQTEIILKLLKEGMVFVDIGANIGYFSLLAANIVGKKGRVVVFEPDIDNYALLVQNIEKNGYKNITAVQKAVSDKTGKAMFYLRKENLNAHSLVQEENTTATEVETITLDDFLKDNYTAHMIKMDIEGAEPAALKGMHSVLRANKKVALIVEFFPKAIERSGYSPEQFLHDLEDMGFILYRIAEKSGDKPEEIKTEIFSAFARGEGVPKLINILCLQGHMKNWNKGNIYDL